SVRLRDFDPFDRLRLIGSLEQLSPNVWPVLTDSRHDLPIAPNRLDQKFAAERPNQVWLADVTYVPTGQGWLYLAVVLDLFTRKIVGWAMRDHLRAELTIAALTMAIQRQTRRLASSTTPIAAANMPPPITAKFLKAARMIQSMSRKGNCWDNAPMDLFGYIE